MIRVAIKQTSSVQARHQRLRFLGIKRVDLGLHEHVGEHEVFEAGNALRRTGFVVTLEGFEKVRLRLSPLFLAHVHFTTALANNALDKEGPRSEMRQTELRSPNPHHDFGVRDRALDRQTLLVKGLELLVVFRFRGHLDLKSKHF